MKLDKAIEILSDEVPYLEPDYSPDYIDATKLGIQALNYYKNLKNDGLLRVDFMLPGETLD